MKKRRNWSLLFEYIEYFDSRPKTAWAGGGKEESGSITMPYPVYSEKTGNFIRVLEHTGVTDIDYLHILMENGIDIHEKFPELIDSADEKLLCAMLTFYVRQERFADGLMAAAIEEGIIARILRQLRNKKLPDQQAR